MITLQNIHLVKLPPMENVEPPSDRKAMPASTRQTSAIAGKSWRRRRTMSARICGVGMLDLPRYDGGGPAPARVFLERSARRTRLTKHLRLPAKPKTRANA